MWDLNWLIWDLNWLKCDLNWVIWDLNWLIWDLNWLIWDLIWIIWDLNWDMWDLKWVIWDLNWLKWELIWTYRVKEALVWMKKKPQKEKLTNNSEKSTNNSEKRVWQKMLNNNTKNIEALYERLKIHLLKISLKDKIIKLINPRREHPVNSAQMPKVPPKFAILSVVVVLTSSLVISISELLYFSRTIMMLFIKFCAILK